MSIRPFNRHCPHCNHKVTITDSLYSTDFHGLGLENADGRFGLSSTFKVCPNPECRKATLDVVLRNFNYSQPGVKTPTGDPIKAWRLIPAGSARPFPEYVPLAIRQDYAEACLIRDLSPKAAATLARRSLQGILRDFYEVKPGRLVDEIDALDEKMEPELLEAIHGVRKVGNIGAHMEADINLIVEVDPEEAKLLIELVETMIEETYVRRAQRQERLSRVSAMAAAKEVERKAPAATAAAAAGKPPTQN
jgi:hypothetical protein